FLRRQAPMKRRLPTPLLETLVRTERPMSVTRRSEREGDPRAAGLTPDAVTRMWHSVERLYRSGITPAAALCVRRRGHIVLDRAIGHARGNAPTDGKRAERVQATPDTLFNIFSASKSITAMLIHLLDDRGMLHIDDRVAEYIPEFG